MAELETMEEILQSLAPGEKRALLSDPQGFKELLVRSNLE